MKKKKSILFVVFIFIINLSLFSQVGIGISTADASSILDVTSTTKGFLPPRMTTSERNLIGAGTPATGMLIYNVTTNQLNYYNGSAWQIVDTSTGFVNLTTDQTNIAGNKTFTGTLTPGGRLMLPMGEISFYNYSGASVTISSPSSGASGNDNMNRVNPAGTVFVNDLFGTGTSGRLTYTGAITRLFHIALSFSYTPGSNNDVYVFGVARNGAVQDSSKVFMKTGNIADHQSSAIHVLLTLTPNDYIEFYVGKIGGSGSIVMKSFNFFAMGM